MNQNPSDKIESLLSAPCWLLDFLPEQVPADGRGPYFAVERYFLQRPQITALRRKFASLLLKLHCYYDFWVFWNYGEDGVRNPEPETLATGILNEKNTLQVLLNDGESLLFLADDLYMTVYAPSETLLSLLRPLAEAEGLFLRKAPDTEDQEQERDGSQ